MPVNPELMRRNLIRMAGTCLVGTWPVTRIATIQGRVRMKTEGAQSS